MEQSITGDAGSLTLPLNPGENLVTIEATTVAASTQLILQSRSESNGGKWGEHQDPEDETTNAQLDTNDGANGGGYARHFVLRGPGEVRVYGVNFSTTTGAVLRVRPSEAKS